MATCHIERDGLTGLETGSSVLAGLVPPGAVGQAVPQASVLGVSPLPVCPSPPVYRDSHTALGPILLSMALS